MRKTFDLEYPPLWNDKESDRATTAKLWVEAFSPLWQAGAMSTEDLGKELNARNIFLTKVELEEVQQEVEQELGPDGLPVDPQGELGKMAQQGDDKEPPPFGGKDHERGNGDGQAKKPEGQGRPFDAHVLNAEFDESKHPRADDGRFGDKPGEHAPPAPEAKPGAGRTNPPEQTPPAVGGKELTIQREIVYAVPTSGSHDFEATAVSNGRMKVHVSDVPGSSGAFRISGSEPGANTFADYDRHGNRTGQGEDWITKPTDAQLVEWDSIAESLSERMARDMPAIAGDEYIRFNPPPKSGFSKNHATGQPEGGVSAFTARYNRFMQGWELASEGENSSAHMLYALKGSPVYLLRATRAGRGSDGEPVLKNIVSKTRLRYDPESETFRETKRFNPSARPSSPGEVPPPVKESLTTPAPAAKPEGEKKPEKPKDA
jgi:hypothetical protein